MSRWLLLICFSLFIAPGLAQANNSTHTTTLLQSTLPNGMRIVVQSAPWEKLVRVEMYYCAGSATDPDSLAGLAHLSEHILTKSSKNHPDGELGRLQKLYTTFCNAYTGASSMRFVNQLLPDFLPQILSLEVDRMQKTTTDSVSFEREKRVVQEELAYRSRLSPFQEFLLSIFQTAYPGHPFARDVGGSQESVGRATTRDFVTFHENNIKPNKAVLVISGPVDTETTMKLVREQFNFGQAAEPFIPDFPEYPEIVADQVFRDSHDHSGLKVGFACRIPLQDIQDAVLAFSLAEFLDDTWLGMNLWTVPDEAIFMVNIYYHYSRFDPDQDAQEGLGDLWAELGETLDELAQTKAFNKARRRVMNKVGQQDEMSWKGSGTGQALINGNQFLDHETMTQVLKNLQPSDLQDFARRYLHPEVAVVGVSHGSDSGRSATIKMAKRVAPQKTLNTTDNLVLLGQDLIEPVLEIYNQANLFHFEKNLLPNGIPVHSLILPDAERWYIGGCRTFACLKDLRQSKKAGLNHLYNLVVDYDDNQKKDNENYAPPHLLPYDVTITLRAWGLKYRASGLPKNSARMTSVLNQRLTKNTFNTRRWAYAMRQGKSWLSSIRSNENNAATTWRMGLLLGENHPALSQWSPNPQTASSVKYKDLKKLHDKAANDIGNTVLVAAGPIESQEFEQIFQRKFWPENKRETGVDYKKMPKKHEGIQGRVFSDLTKGDVKLSVSFGPMPIQPSDPGFSTAALLFSEALQQSLLLQLREKEGLTYTTSCYLLPISGMLFLGIDASCQPGQAPIALSKLIPMLEQLAQDGFTPDALSRARLALTCHTLRSFVDAESARDTLLQMATFGELPTDPMAMIYNIKPGQVNAIAKGLLETDNFVFTATGPMFEEDIDQFDFGGP